MVGRSKFDSEGRFAVNTPPIVLPHEWEPARQELLVKEKELARAPIH
jgi:predicted dithiol-disulfide oxidoreductase (DUF899 family)